MLPLLNYRILYNYIQNEPIHLIRYIDKILYIGKTMSHMFINNSYFTGSDTSSDKAMELSSFGEAVW